MRKNNKMKQHKKIKQSIIESWQYSYIKTEEIEKNI